MTDTALEIRKNDDGQLDEVVARGCDVHLEQMDEGEDGEGELWFLQVSIPGGRTLVVFFSGQLFSMSEYDAPPALDAAPERQP